MWRKTGEEDDSSPDWYQKRKFSYTITCGFCRVDYLHGHIPFRLSNIKSSAASNNFWPNHRSHLTHRTIPTLFLEQHLIHRWYTGDVTARVYQDNKDNWITSASTAPVSGWQSPFPSQGQVTRCLMVGGGWPVCPRATVEGGEPVCLVATAATGAATTPRPGSGRSLALCQLHFLNAHVNAEIMPADSRNRFTVDNLHASIGLGVCRECSYASF